MFPQARQVGQYLAAYSQRYIPRDMLRLGHRVVKTERLTGSDVNCKWKVSWVKGSRQNTTQETTPQTKIESEDFDFLVVASGYFARPYLPVLPGLEHFTGQAIHSSTLEKGRAGLSTIAETTPQGNTVVIGGSMSGVEAASALALRESSLRLSTYLGSGSPQKNNKVYHVHSRPFWTLPTYLPCETSEETVPFLPLDLAMYDLSRRPPGPVEYTLGPLSEEKIAKTNDYFRSLLGAEYERYGHPHQQSPLAKADPQPEWVAIGNDYAEFVRSGGIKTVMGRATSIHPQSDTRIASMKIETAEGSQILEDVTSIVMATGFTPFDSLSFLPDDVLSSLEYNTSDPFLPLILDKGGTLRSEIPDLGFVGFYRGPYWGVMEMQAKFLGKEWAAEDNTPGEGDAKNKSERELLRILRQPSVDVRRAQFPMGDYVGLMETFSKDLQIERTLSSGDDSRTGPVIPARYAHGQEDVEARRTLDSLRAISCQDHSTAAQAAASLAVFRALHGTWRYTQTSATGERVGSGTVAFIPRYPSNEIHDREYVLETRQDEVSAGFQVSSVGRAVFCLSEAGTRESNPGIQVYDVTTDRDREESRLAYRLHLTPFYREEGVGEYVINAERVHANAAEEPTARGIRYTFHFQGVSITEWECVQVGDRTSENNTNSESQSELLWQNIYKR
ncbi:FAD-dependent pyridine nucleotide-disulfide oxidoreductase [Penicillium cataractarum]|uniref:FAD-dependent pyridine nucleotide-disulfide oxidoreductase n=1 Tax=Penicillium cataractarum TaxID=2100454 RepID=A0A9W9RFC9_9EURO|nr:FAD-dependent pyridine nucleotide-disulfide oxidoreductase [Penicillium cataractarum]KAJ5359076.1 FAD-dependent pyridine nucleotide-disulfide oxidoreductase [Penicillium cataractarum]